ncbi:50S ribosomal protein L29 [Patescibacteria group bacterium]|nr:50S ribosomal protein L29 [Patescibacteria group bacterium]
MKAKDLQKRPTADLKKTVRELQDKLRELRFDLTAGKVKNIKEIRSTRREIARIYTIVCQKENSLEK